MKKENLFPFEGMEFNISKIKKQIAQWSSDISVSQFDELFTTNQSEFYTDDASRSLCDTC